MTRYAFAVDDAASVTRTLTHNLEGKLSSTALTLFRVLHTVAVTVAAARGYAVGVSQVSFFCPVEAVALALGVHRSTIYRALAELRALGCVAHRAHYTTLDGRTRADGAVFAVRLRPLEGRAARLSYDELKRQYRSLSADIRAGRTVFSMMRQSKDSARESVLELSYIYCFALPIPTENPVTSDCRTAPRIDLEAVLDLTGARRSERRGAVDLAAQALALALRDRDSLNFYRRLCHALLRRYDASGQDQGYAVYLAAQRAAVDAREGFARRPGALFVSRLKGSGLFAELGLGPPSIPA